MPAAAATHHRLVGDALHIVQLAGIAAYGAAIFQLLTGKNNGDGDGQRWSSFDPDWMKSGFCMTHDDVPWLTTHERSGYIMIAFGIIGFILLHALQDSSGKMDCARERVKWALVGAFGHAMGHITIAMNKRAGLLPEDGNVTAISELLADDANVVTFAKHVPGYLLFWLPVVKTYMQNISSGRLALYAFIIQLGAMMMPLKLGLSYTLIILFAGQSLDQLFFLPKQYKNSFDYMLWPMVVSLPSFCLSVMESKFCTLESLPYKTHGHMIFDGYMAFSYSLYYLGCWLWNHNNLHSKSGKFL